MAEYDEHGVCLHESVSFSKYGTVGKTLELLIDNLPKGCSAVGRGGDELMAELLDLNPKTVARGRRELLGGKADVDTIREKGGGRKHIKKKSRT
ncbi:MAG: hypothetical protein GY866_09825 [Proteobacteria bacterium]|nr:hypothetical protein [Pseudomonadota bacterium]